MISTLLVIDSDPASRQILESLADGYDVKILEAGSLAEGLLLSKEQTVDLIVMDMFLPQKSGFSLIAEITANGGHPPIIATFSASSAPRINIKKFTHILGAACTLEKPLDRTLLHQAFRELVPQAKLKISRSKSGTEPR